MVLSALLAGFRPAAAGPNEGGALILHCEPTLEFTTDGDYNGYCELRNCKNAVTQVPGDGQGVVYFVLAAFDDFASPRIKGVSFGLDLSSPSVEPIRWGPSGDEVNLEIWQDNWPAAGSGTGVTWSEPIRGRLSELYWFMGYAYAGQTVKLTDHPAHEGEFADDEFPRVTDPIEEYGMMGFGVAGYNPCAEDVATGACCGGSGQCVLATKEGCNLYDDYNYQGDNTSCSPNPCTPGVGACCIRVDCRMLGWDECLDGGGFFMGEGVGCDPSPCDFSRIETTWGTLKSTYRWDQPRRRW